MATSKDDNAIDPEVHTRAIPGLSDSVEAYERKITQLILNRGVRGKNLGSSSNDGIQKLVKDLENVKGGVTELKNIYNRLDISKKETIYKTTTQLLKMLSSQLDIIKLDIDRALEVLSGSGGKAKEIMGKRGGK